MISQTDRLILRRFKREDIPSFIAYRNDPEISKYQGWIKIIDKSYALNFLDSQNKLKFGDIGVWVQIAFEEIESGIHIGDCALRVFDDGRQAEFGVTIERSFQNRGYGYEGLMGLFKLAFLKLKVNRIIALVDVDNTPSIKLLEKLNMRKEAHFLKSYFDGEEWRDEYQYAILSDELRN